MELSKKRIDWIDIAKGISIILVVYGHSGFNNVPFFGSWLCVFRMPFFFFVSGLLFSGYKYETIIPFVGKRVKTLYRPYFIFSAMLMLGIWILNDPAYSTPGHMLRYIITGWEGWALWFIPVLSLTEILFYYIARIHLNVSKKIVILVFFAVIGRLFYLLDVPNPYNVWFVLTSVLFYGLGSFCKTYVIELSRKKLSKIFVGAIAAFILSLVYLIAPPNTLPEFAVNNMASTWIYPAALGGTLFMCTMAMASERFKNVIVQKVLYFIKYMGKNSYVVLAFHQIVLQLLGKTGIFNNGSLQRLMMWVILILLIYSINNYCPSIIGRQKPISRENKN